MIKWPEFKFGGINLWNRPLQEIDYMKKEVDDCKFVSSQAELYKQQCDSIVDIAEKRLKHLKKMYYLRTGKIL